MKTHLLRLLLVALIVPVAAPACAQQNMANYETRLASIEDQMRALNGQLEQIGFSIRRLDQNLQRLQSDDDMRLSKLETTVANLSANADARAAPAASMAPAVNAPPAVIDGTLGAIKTQDGRVTGAISNPQAPPLPDTPPDYGLTAQEQYDRAYGLMLQADYVEAEKAFKAFIDKNPKDKQIDNAKYWHAQTLYVRGLFPEAAVSFADAYQQNPQSPKAADNLLQLALSLAAMNKTSDACTSLAALKAKYPNANAKLKLRAGEESTRLKCSAT